MRGLLLTSCLLLTLSVFGQRIKYKELFPQIQNEQEETAIMLIKEYLRVEPEHPNANYLLTSIYRDRFLGADVLTQNQMALANAEQARLRILKCRSLIDEREIRRNSEYYLGEAGSMLDWPAIDSLMTATYEVAGEYMDKVPPIYENFTRSVIFYDRAIKSYARICGSYNSLDNLLLLFDDRLDEDLLLLKQDYDSMNHYFGMYKALTAEYPIGYDQELNIVPIERFRLQGLVARVSFLNNSISVWDYGKWVDEIRSKVNAEVSDLRERLISNDEGINAVMDELPPANEEYSSVLDKELVFQMEKLDFQSLPIALLRYKDYKARLLHDELNRTYYDTSMNLEASSKYIYYSNMINSVRMADTLLTEVGERNTELKIDKHQQFFSERYGGADGLNTFIQVERNQIGARFEDYIRGLRNTIVDNQDVLESDSGIFITDRRTRYPAWITGVPDSLATNTYYTTIEKINADGSHYLGGNYIKEDGPGNLVSFIYKVRDNKLEWFKEFDISIDSVASDANNRLGAMELTRDGVLFMVNSRHMTTDMALNTLYFLDESGNETMEKTLESVAEFPRMIRYDEAGNRFLLVFKGSSGEYDLQISGPARILAINEIGDRIWERTLEYAGDVVDLIRVQDGYMLVANYTRIVAAGMNVSAGEDGQTKTVVFHLDGRGNTLGIQMVPSKMSYYITHVVKASDSNINLLGYEGNRSDYDGRKLEFGRDLVHVLLDGYTRVISSSLD